MTRPVAALLWFFLLPAAAHAAPDPAYLADLVRRAHTARLADDPQWLRLGHYRPRLLGGWKSQVDGKEFFLAKDGKTDPAAELDATLAALFDDRPKKEELDDAMCRFPARLQFLADRLGLDPERLPRRACPKLEDYLARTRPQAVTLVFSSYYLNNPASAFGHTLLRLDKSGEARGERAQELLDHGVDYAATVDTSNAIFYAAKGLFGLFKGEFKIYAYYYKVRQYGDYESRDLWEYELALSPAEVAMLTAHVWELGGTYFDYWYLDENCSYHMLSALEAAAPRLDLLSHVGPVIVLPSDTIRALFRNPGLVRAVHYRPSMRTQFEARARRLDGVERGAVERLASEPQAPLPAALGQAARADVLDAALDLFDVRNAKGLLLGGDPEAARLRQVLLERRAAEPLASPPLDVPVPEAQRPDVGHGSLRAGAGGGASRAAGGFAELDFRLALHDLADPPEGFPPYATLEFLPARLRVYGHGRRVELDDASFVRVVSLNPISRFDLRPSWRLRAGATTVRDGGCDRCLAGAAEFGGGLDVGGGDGAFDLAVLADSEVLGAPGLAGLDGSGVRLGLGPSALLRARAGRFASLVAEARWRWLPVAHPEQTWSLSAGVRLHAGRDLSLALEGRRTPSDDSVSAAVLGYF